ncbi:hypothetical protein [Pseudoalteromonas rubra]|uniref:Uncharacterized protein n=1 Tax=Pseudoalteromonas rubra TaxID=43658 RepID=A0A5S3X0T0_9GAMM|nr:hypothetical protein [Pseudoalteromonas rubra]TMP37593.1 hypothetical protein CWB98_10480 [Pseudoalteromonas rubra]
MKLMQTLSVLACMPTLALASQLPTDALYHLSTGAKVAAQSSTLDMTPKTHLFNSVIRAAQADISAASTITPMCQTLSLNTVYPFGGMTVGQKPCFHFEVTEPGKTTAFLFGQSVDTNINLSIVRHNPDNTFTLMANSANAANADELAAALTEPGHYYWLMDVIATDSSDIKFGAISSTQAQLDDFEANDSIATVTMLPDKQNRVKGNIDNVFDYDYFAFTAVRGQDLIVKLEDEAKTDEFVLEIYNGGNWQPVAVNKAETISQLQENQSVVVRVSGNPNLQNNPANQYTLVLGSVVASFAHDSVSGEHGVERIPYSAFKAPYLTTQAYRDLNWTVTLNDSKGHPVEGAEATFKLIRDFDSIDDVRNPYEDFVVTSDANGKASGGVNLGRCFSDYTVEHSSYSMGYRNTWRTDFLVGAWRIEIDSYEEKVIGIGGTQHPYVYIGHLCDQDLVSSTRN